MTQSGKLAIALLMTALVVAGCESTGVGDRDRPYAKYYPLMTEAQRVDFSALRLTAERQDYIKMHGLDIALLLHERLRVGMSPEQVREILGAPWSVEAHTVDFGKRAGSHVSWFYRSFEGVSRPIISGIRFHDDAVEEWSTWRQE